MELASSMLMLAWTEMVTADVWVMVVWLVTTSVEAVDVVPYGVSEVPLPVVAEEMSVVMKVAVVPRVVISVTTRVAVVDTVMSEPCAWEVVGLGTRVENVAGTTV